MKPVSESAQYHPLSLNYLNNTSLTHRKKRGQYFTPKNIRKELLDLLPSLDQPKILDPGCGSGEFLAEAKLHYPDGELNGWDIEDKLLRIAESVCPGAHYSKRDALSDNSDKEYDLIIGNPPYYEFKPEDNIKEIYADVISGRPNIFALFIKKGLMLLKDGGYLAFVVPPSMNNGAFFKNLRQYILKQSSIVKLKILDSQELFNSARQTVMLLVLQKKTGGTNYIFEKNGLMIFTPDRERLNKKFKGMTTFYEQGFKIRTGNIVWNENKDRLTNDPKDAVPLIWSHNIKNGLIDLSYNDNKPQYIRTDSFATGPALVVNRVTGSVANSGLRTAVISCGTKFTAENHVNVIFPPAEFEATMCALTGIAEYLMTSKIAEVIKLVTGNTQLSKTELERLLPLPKKLFRNIKR